MDVHLDSFYVLLVDAVLDLISSVLCSDHQGLPAP